VDRKTANSFVIFIFSAFLLREYVPSAVQYFTHSCVQKAQCIFVSDRCVP
jgi:hypothetical protein